MEFLHNMKIPGICIVDKPVYKTLFFKNVQMSTADKRSFDRLISSIRLYAVFQPDTINIPVYKDEIRDYSSVVVLLAALKEEQIPSRLAEIIMHAIPYPMMLFFLYGEKWQLWMTGEHVNPSNPSQMVLENIVHSEWDDEEKAPFVISEARFTNLYDFYTDLLDTFSKYLAVKKGMAHVADGIKARESLVFMEELEKEIDRKRAQLKREDRFARRVSMNVEVQKLKAQLQQMKEGE